MALPDYTIVVNSCDLYEDLWFPFFTVFQEMWPNCGHPIVLNTESKTFSFKGLEVITVHKDYLGKNVEWGRRLKETLSSIKTDYVITLFDDFFLETPVDQKKIDQCLIWMENRKEIAVFYFNKIAGKNIVDGEFYGYERLPQRKDYRLNSAPALWRKEKLISYTGNHDNPWAWEFFGSARTYRTNDLFYCAQENHEDVFRYNYKLGGAIHRGMWVLSVVKPVIDRHRIKLDLSKRGIEDETLTVYRHSFGWKLNFLLTGITMIGFDVFIFIYRGIKRRMSRFLGVNLE